MKKNTTCIKAASQHTIGYAYPTSIFATKLRAPKGTYYIENGKNLSGHPSYAACKHFVGSKPTIPSRWSMDHPANAHFLAHAK